MEVVSFESSGLEVVHPQHPSPQHQSVSPPQGSLQSPTSQYEPNEAVADQYKGHYAFAQQQTPPSWKYVEQSSPESQTMNANQYQPPKKSWPWWPLVASVTVAVLIVGGAVGGGVGSKLSSCEADLRRHQAVSEAVTSTISQSTSLQSTTPTSTDSVSTTSSAPALETTDGGLITNYVAELPSNVYSLADNCTELAATTQTTSSGKTKFSLYCDVDFGTGRRKDGDGNNITLSDLICLSSYSMQDCLNACGDYTYRSSKSGRDAVCGSVTYSIFMSTSATNNCCLKNSTVTHTEGSGYKNGCISAILIV
ncbi:hypothetical protein GGR57DRAFT_200978 [Xylariaceae sp. FL1272]|nr:hypothetical protein GGR57DRAFT_200978 [Xylariaceae sp. FL1272]